MEEDNQDLSTKSLAPLSSRNDNGEIKKPVTAAEIRFFSRFSTVLLAFKGAVTLRFLADPEVLVVGVDGLQGACSWLVVLEHDDDDRVSF